MLYYCAPNRLFILQNISIAQRVRDNGLLQSVTRIKLLAINGAPGRQAEASACAQPCTQPCKAPPAPALPLLYLFVSRLKICTCFKQEGKGSRATEQPLRILLVGARPPWQQKDAFFLSPSWEIPSTFPVPSCSLGEHQRPTWHQSVG